MCQLGRSVLGVKQDLSAGCISVHVQDALHSVTAIELVDRADWQSTDWPYGPVHRQFETSRQVWLDLNEPRLGEMEWAPLEPRLLRLLPIQGRMADCLDFREEGPFLSASGRTGKINK